VGSEIKATAKHEYTSEAAHAEDHLELAVGDVITVIDKSQVEWWMCEKKEKQGYVPSQFLVEHLKP